MTQARTIAAQVKDADLVADRRAHIASAAARVFRAKGFHNATIRDVAIAAGLSQGSLYNYVRSKDDILYLVHQDLTAGYAAYVEQAIAGIVEPRARLRAALAAFTHAMAERHADITLIYQETHALGDESRRAVLAQTNHVIQRFEQLIADARAAGMALPGAGRLAVLTDFAATGLDELLGNVSRASGHPVRLLILDPAGDFLDADENDAGPVKKLMRLLREKATAHGCTILRLDCHLRYHA
jgi:AcrR family transcriptional regulator